MNATDFARIARIIGRHCREHKLVVPSFRSPPRTEGTHLTVRFINEGALVSVTIRDRMLDEIIADMIEGAVIANKCGRNHGDILTDGLRSAVQEGL